MKRRSLKLPPERENNLRLARRILRQNTDSRTIDDALAIVINLKENSEYIAPQILRSIVGEDNMGKFYSGKVT